MRSSVLILLCLVPAIVVSCVRVNDRRAETPPVLNVEREADSTAGPAVRVGAAGGSPVLVTASGERRALEIGARAEGGGVIAADASSWVELAFDGSSDPAALSFAVVRVLPGTRITLRRLGGADDDGLSRIVEIELDAGSVAVKAGTLSIREEFLVVSPHAAASARGADFVFDVGPDRTSVSVRRGAVSVLPQTPLSASLLDGRAENPVAGAVIRAAFVFAPVARAGERLAAGEASQECGAAYGALLVAAERARSNGIDLEEADDPTPFIAAAGSDAEKKLRAAFALIRPAPITAAAPIFSVLALMRGPSEGRQ